MKLRGFCHNSLAAHPRLTGAGKRLFLLSIDKGDQFVRGLPILPVGVTECLDKQSFLDSYPENENRNQGGHDQNTWET